MCPTDMATLDEIFASGGPEVIIRTLELNCPAWDEPVLICTGFKDQLLGTEDGRLLLFTAANIGITLPKKNNKGNQALAFSVDNTTGEPQRKVDQARDQRARITATYRTYTSGNKQSPSAKPYTMTLQTDSIQGNVAQLQCGFFDMIGIAWPRVVYTLNQYPSSGRVHLARQQLERFVDCVFWIAQDISLEGNILATLPRALATRPSTQPQPIMCSHCGAANDGSMTPDMMKTAKPTELPARPIAKNETPQRWRAPLGR